MEHACLTHLLQHKYNKAKPKIYVANFDAIPGMRGGGGVGGKPQKNDHMICYFIGIVSGILVFAGRTIGLYFKAQTLSHRLV